MSLLKLLLIGIVYSVGLLAHPMGNFSVSHYSNLRVTPEGVDLLYALDLAEIPTFELLRGWNLDRSSPQAALDRKASAQARIWLAKLVITAGGKPVAARIDSAHIVLADGAGNLPVARITIHSHVNSVAGNLTYLDGNYPDRAGWKEIVLEAAAGATLSHVSQGGKDISHALTQYPPDPTVAPPQDLRAELSWSLSHPVAIKPQPVVHPRSPVPAEAAGSPVIQSVPQPDTSPMAASPATLTPQGAPAGSVVRGDYLSRFLHQRELTPGMIFFALGVSLFLGAAHALTPGHGKTIVAAYLVGSRGTLKHAVFLGAMVTFTHTISVFALGLATLFLFRQIVPEKITQALGAISGLSIVAIGGWMLYQRLHDHAPSLLHAHSHDPQHDHSHAPAHPQEQDSAPGHRHGTLEHSHGSSTLTEDHHHIGHTHTDADHSHPAPAGQHHHSHGHGGHSHMPTELSWAGLAALGASGALVPCESALVLLLSAIALGRVGLGLLLLVSFSLGLAVVLMAIGVLVLYAKNLIPERQHRPGGIFRWLAVGSSAFVIAVGMVMTAVSLGWLSSKWTI